MQTHIIIACYGNFLEKLLFEFCKYLEYPTLSIKIGIKKALRVEVLYGLFFVIVIGIF